ncbi:hypothetical protein Shyhy01_02780 [Streptomyces hygroscopicus subsp. hygroscopicus]|nr:hypothetical protein Shyhy01_02780 [Streptomyces hygroscopicus subsp. hygroscopicus]
MGTAGAHRPDPQRRGSAVQNSLFADLPVQYDASEWMEEFSDLLDGLEESAPERRPGPLTPRGKRSSINSPRSDSRPS